jgi:molybdopterin-guanine dinucleotide biosynthesis protein MobB
VLAPSLVKELTHYKVLEEAKMNKTRMKGKCMKKTRIFAISGFSGSGKTTLLSKLVEGLRKDMNSVAVIKSSKDDVLAPSGTDTRYHQDAGADPVVLLGPNTTTIRYRARKDLIEIFSEMNTDYILLEGFKQYNIPRFWCIGNKEEIPHSSSENIKAIVKWNKSEEGVDSNQTPIIMIDEVETLLDIVKKEAILLNEFEL